MMKRMICGLLVCLLLVLPLCGCGDREEARIKVVCTVFPLYDWVRNVVGDTEGVEILWLADNGSDLHSFQPSASDMIELATADLAVYVGGVSDAWVGDSLKNGKVNSGMPLSKEEGILLRPVSAESGHTDEDGHTHETDEHLWLSLENAILCVERIALRLGELDAAYAEEYRANAEEYTAKLRGLASSFGERIAGVEQPRVLFADRFPFVYLIEEYGIEYRAAFSGCTTDVDADFSTVIELANTVDRWGLRYVLVTESSDLSLAEGVIRATEGKDQTVLRMDSMQAVRAEEAESGVTYLSVMEENLSTLLLALGLDLND